MTITQAIILFLLSGLASLDRIAGMNIMLSRPIVLSGMIGYTFDTLIICLLVGSIFEFIGMLEVPVGTVVTKDDTFAGYSASVLISLGATSQNAVSLLLSIILVGIMIYPVTLTDVYARKFNQLMISISFKNKNTDKDSLLIRIGLVLAFLRGVIVYNIATAIIFAILYHIEPIHNTSYNPNLYLTLLAVFLMGYMLRFFHIVTLLKPVVFMLGATFAWLIL